MMEKLTQEYLKECLHYNPETGIFTWKRRPISHFKDGVIVKKEHICNRWNTHYANTIAGYKSKLGYIEICINNKGCLAHRLAWIYSYGYDSENEIDHFDRDPSNNRIVNLRETGRVCQMQNTGDYKNNTSGVKGVSRQKQNKNWRAYININDKQKHIGSFLDFNDAVMARWAEERDNNLWTCWTDSSAYNYLKDNNLLKEDG